MTTNTEYVERVRAAVAAQDGDVLAALTSRCPECDEDPVTWGTETEHVMVGGDVGPWKYAVLVGCEGYWCVDPALVGIDAPMWEPTD